MLAVKPILYKKIPFNAQKSTVFQYSYNGDVQKFNKLTVRDNDTNAIVYDVVKIAQPETLSYPLDANKLTNTKNYNATITVYTGGTEASPTGANPPSDKIYFKCLADPVLKISNLSNDQIIPSSSFSVEFTYFQATVNPEPLDYFVVNLFDGNTGRIIKTSNNLYPSTNGLLPSYLLVGLLNNGKYRVNAVGKTLNGMVTTSPDVNFTVNYSAPPIYSQMYVSNIPEQASVKIESNYKAIEGSSIPSPPKYIDNLEVDLSAQGHYVIFDKGFSFSPDFAIVLDVRNITNNNTPFLRIMGNGDFTSFGLRNNYSTRESVPYIYTENPPVDGVGILSVSQSNPPAEIDPPADGIDPVEQLRSITIQKQNGVFGGVSQDYFVLYAKEALYYNYRIVSNTLKVLTKQDKCRLKIRRKNNFYMIEAEVVT